MVTFVILWCSEPWRLGEVMHFPPAGGDCVFGRGGARTNDPGRRVQFGKRSELAARSPMEIPQISRIQALLRVRHHDMAIDVHNVGRAGLTLNGYPVEKCRVGPGDLVQFGRQLLLVCVVEHSATTAVNNAYPEHTHGQPDAFGLVGESAAIWKLRRQLAFVGPRTGHVLIHGPSGSGKELVANAIHRLSRGGPMVARNAATLPEGIIDAELFGNVRNYPNPGMPERHGLVGQADESTLYLDEFAELPLTLQTHLLRVLDSGEYQRLGEAVARRSRFRLIASTNRPIATIKEDLLARLQYRIQVPDLNQRREDIPLLLLHLLRTFMTEDPSIARFFPNGNRDGLPRISLTFLRKLVLRRYRTNARELSVIVWSAIQNSDGDIIQAPEATPESTGDGANLEGTPVDRDENTEEREQIRAALARHNGNLEATWQALGFRNRYQLRRLIKKYDLKP
ncbi:sigma-54-dependent transcriptional regulator [Pendulispora albinea]|uniref:Sigma 54-interacting transcriptional regulator n=1 Tax=Pendulispora albinea TaxID=2741071 RepID=A0ABZ2M870_9BACT